MFDLVPLQNYVPALLTSSECRRFRSHVNMSHWEASSQWSMQKLDVAKKIQMLCAQVVIDKYEYHLQSRDWAPSWMKDVFDDLILYDQKKLT